MVLGSLAVPAASAGTAADPEVTDSEGDQEVTRGQLVLPTQEVAFDDIDIRAVWVDTGIEGQPVFTIETGAAPLAGANFTLTYRLERGPTSLVDSVATGAEETLELVLEEDHPGPEVSLGTDFTTFAGVGGDLITIVAVQATRTDTGGLPQDLTPEDDQTGADEAGPAARAFMLPRPPVEAGLSVTVAVVNGTPLEAPATYDATAPLQVIVTVENTGTDPDTVRLRVSHGTLAQEEVALGPGEDARIDWSVPAVGASANLRVTATSDRGASEAAALTLRVPEVPPEEREPVPEGLSFLSAAALGMGFDHIFGALAELVLMALLLLLAILAVYLAGTLGRRWPAAADLPPPTKPERDLLMGAGIHPGTRPPTPGAHPAADTRPLPAAEPREAVARTAAPAASATPLAQTSPRVVSATRADPRRTASIRDAVARLGPAGTPERRLSAMRRAEAPLAAAAKPPLRGNSLAIRVRAIEHRPESHRPGQEVETTATVENEGDGTAHVVVEVQVRGETVASKTMQVAAHSTAPLRLRWQARSSGQPRIEVRGAD